LRDDLADLAEGVQGRSNAVFRAQSFERGLSSAVFQVKQSRFAPALGRGDFVAARSVHTKFLKSA